MEGFTWKLMWCWTVTDISKRLCLWCMSLITKCHLGYQICGKFSMYLFMWSWRVLIPSNGVEVRILYSDDVVLVWTAVKVGNRFGWQHWILYSWSSHHIDRQVSIQRKSFQFPGVFYCGPLIFCSQSLCKEEWNNSKHLTRCMKDMRHEERKK